MRTLSALEAVKNVFLLIGGEGLASAYSATVQGAWATLLGATPRAVLKA